MGFGQRGDKCGQKGVEDKFSRFCGGAKYTPPRISQKGVYLSWNVVLENVFTLAMRWILTHPR